MSEDDAFEINRVDTHFGSAETDDFPATGLTQTIQEQYINLKSGETLTEEEEAEGAGAELRSVRLSTMHDSMPRLDQLSQFHSSNAYLSEKLRENLLPERSPLDQAFFLSQHAS